MSHKGRKRSDRMMEYATLDSIRVGRYSALRIPCNCMPALPHSATLALTVKGKLRNEATLLGYDGTCTLGTKLERTFVEGYEETQPDKKGEVRKILTRHIQPAVVREMVV